MIMLVAAIILAVIGFFVGVVVAVVAAQRIIGRHIHLLHKRQLVQEFRVMDLQDYDLDRPISTAPIMENETNSNINSSGGFFTGETSGGLGNVEGGGGGGLEMTAKRPPPSAPIIPVEDVEYLKRFGLIDGR